MRTTARHAIFPLLAGIALIAAGCGMFGGDATLTGQVWEWGSAATDAPGSETVIPEPERYTIEFLDDGTISSKADCNQVNGEYTSPGGGALTITLGASTLVACPEDSMADAFLAGLAGTSSYAIENGQLSLTTTAGTMTFE